MKTKMVLAVLVALIFSVCGSSCTESKDEQAFVQDAGSVNLIGRDTVEVAAYCLVSGGSIRCEQIDLLFSNGCSFQSYRYVSTMSTVTRWSKKEQSNDPFYAKETHICVIGYTLTRDIVFIENLTVKGRIKK